MKKIIIVLFIIFLMGCTTLRYEDDLKEPYTQAEVELSGVEAIAFTAFSILTAGIIYEGVNDF